MKETSFTAFNTGRFLLAFICLAAFGGLPRAIDPDLRMSQYILTTWQTDDGLPQDSVQALIQSSDGYLWIGTYDGLVRFDGKTFTLFNSRNVPAFRVDPVFALLQDRQGRIWAGTTGGGLVRLENGVFRRFDTEDGLPSAEITALYEDRQGDLWVGTSAGPARQTGNRFAGGGRLSGVPAVETWAFLEDRAGRLWVGTQAGLFLADSGARTAAAPTGALAEVLGPVRSLLEDRRGQVWAGTYGHGLYRWDGAWLDNYGTVNGVLTNDVVRALLEDANGNIWAGTGGGGVYRWGRGAFARLSTQEGLSSDVVWALLEDHERNVWAGTGGGGLCQLVDPKVLTLTRADGLAGNHIWTVLEDRAGAVWVGTNGAGLCRVDGQAAYTVRDGLPDNFVRALAIDSAERLWVGCMTGLCCLEKGVLRVSGLLRAGVRAILSDRRGGLWVGTAGAGLFRFEGDRLESATKVEGLPHESISSLMEHPDGTLWAGTRAGIARVTDTGGRPRVEGVIKTGRPVMCLVRDEVGTIWVGTDGDGVFRWAEGRLQPVLPEDGVLDKQIYQVLDDARGGLWLSSNHGIYEVPRDALVRYLEGRGPRPAVRRFGIADGLKGTECNGNNQPAGVRDRKGRLWFPSLSGLVMVQPAAIHRNDVPPPVYVEKIQVGHKETLVKGGGEPEFSYLDRNMEFHYTALSFTNPARVRFEYRLEGHDDGWVAAGTRRVAYYTNLEPGRYTFRVRACNNDEVWNERGATVSFTVKPAFWMTGWFKAAVLLVAAVLLNLAVFGGRRLAERLRYWRQTHTVGAYRILDTLGKGGMGRVYRVCHRRTRDVCALKVLDEGLVDEEARRRFVREGLICERLNDPNIVHILHRGIHQGSVYYVMEYCQGITLREFMNTRPITLGLALTVFRVLAETVARIHAAGVVHRDIKPENVMILKGFVPSAGADPMELAERLRANLKILDFGLSKLAGNQSLTQTGTLLGTFHYMPPEYLSGARVDTAETDFYALGVVLYELLAGRKPYEGTEVAEVLLCALTRPIVPPHEFTAGIPPEVSAFALKLIARDAADRLKEYGPILDGWKALPEWPDLMVCPRPSSAGSMETVRW